MPEQSGETWQRDRLLEALDSYHRGLGDAPILHKWTESEVANTESSQSDAMDFVISTDDVDRHGDVIVASGWRLDAYRLNPVFLWAHDYTRPVIGRALDVWGEPHRLMARMEFAPTSFAQEVAGLYRAGYQRGVSVGFKPLQFEERRHEKTGAFLGIRFLEQELLETSAVPVPANRHALRRALEQAPRVGEYLRRCDSLRNASLAGSAEGLWPRMVAQVDEISKLATELTRMLEDAQSEGTPPVQPAGIDQVLTVLRGARA